MRLDGVERRRSAIGAHAERQRAGALRTDRQLRAPHRDHLRRSAAEQYADVGMTADHGDATHPGGERQHPAVVLEQYDPGLGLRLRDFGMGLIIDSPARDRRRVVDAVREQGAKHAQGRPVHRGFGDLALGQGRLEVGAEKGPLVSLIAGLLIQTRDERAGGVHGAPVRHDEALEAPVALQNVGQQERVFTGIDAVHPVVGAHDRAGLADLARDLERQQVALAHRRLGHVDVVDETTRLGGVHREVLHRRDDAIALDPGDRAPRQQAAQVGVFADVFEVAAATRIADQIDPAGQHHAESLGARLGADHPPAPIREVRIEGSAERDSRGQSGRDIALPHLAGVGDAETCIGLGNGGKAETRDRADIACAQRNTGRRLGVCAAHHLGQHRERGGEQRDLLVQRHRRERRLRTRVGRAARVGPRSAQHLGRRRGPGRGG